jgi:hypothetical protein
VRAVLPHSDEATAWLCRLRELDVTGCERVAVSDAVQWCVRMPSLRCLGVGGGRPGSRSALFSAEAAMAVQRAQEQRPRLCVDVGAPHARRCSMWLGEWSSNAQYAL